MKCDGWIIVAALYVFALILVHFGGIDWKKNEPHKMLRVLWLSGKPKTNQNKDSSGIRWWLFKFDF